MVLAARTPAGVRATGGEVMKKFAIMIGALAATFALQFEADTARAAGIQRTFVSVTGSDQNPCTETSPCQSINAALGATAPGGQIQCLNSGYFHNELQITISVTIDCYGTNASIYNETTGDGIDINAPDDTVVLRGLIIATTGDGFSNDVGVNITAAKWVSIEDCVLAGFWINAINDARTSGPGQLVIKNTAVRQGFSNAGIYIKPGPGVQITATVAGSLIENNSFGIFGDGRSGGTINATISDSVVTDNTKNGITAVSSGSSVVFMIDQTKVTNNSVAGLFAGGGNAGMLARNTTVFGNGTGLATSGGAALYSYGNNSVNGNTTNGAFTGSAALQ
jgi:hypothetical protein